MKQIKEAILGIVLGCFAFIGYNFVQTPLFQEVKAEVHQQIVEIMDYDKEPVEKSDIDIIFTQNLLATITRNSSVMPYRKIEKVIEHDINFRMETTKQRLRKGHRPSVTDKCRGSTAQRDTS